MKTYKINSISKRSRRPVNRFVKAQSAKEAVAKVNSTLQPCFQWLTQVSPGKYF